MPINNDLCNRYMTNCMGQNPFCETNQAVTLSLWKPNIYCLVAKTPSDESNAHTYSGLFKMCFKHCHLSRGLSSGSFPLNFPTKTLYEFVFRFLYAFLISSFLIRSP